MRRLTLALCLAAAVFPAAASGAGRVASIGICADQAVVALLDEDRIAALSPQAGDPVLSVVTKQAERLPVIPPSAEAALMTGADVVVANAYGDGKTVAMLERLGIKVVRVPSAESFDEAAAALVDIGKELGTEQRARALSQDIAARRAALRAGWPDVPVLAAYYRPDGGSAGAGTFVSIAMAAAGLESLATRLGQAGWGRLDMETLVMHPPQAFVVSFFNEDGYVTRRTFGRHPLVRRLMVEMPVVAVPGRLWACGGWPLIEAAELMSRSRREKGLP